MILMCNVLGCFLALLKLNMEYRGHNTRSYSNIYACTNFMMYIPPGIMPDLEQTVRVL